MDTTQLPQQLSRNDRMWFDKFNECKAFYDEHGHFPKSVESERLNHWAKQWWRNSYLKKSQENQYKADLLLSIGFELRVIDKYNDVRWMAKYEEAKAFVEEHGHFPSSHECKKVYFWALAWWRCCFLKKPEANEEKARMLRELGYVYRTSQERIDKDFMANYVLAKAFFEEHGHFPSKSEFEKINKWAKQWWLETYSRNKDKYQDKAELLLAIGFPQ